MSWFDNFDHHQTVLNGVAMRYRVGGNPKGKPLLLVHGAPQTHVMWHRVAQLLQNDYWLVMPDLRGYGDASHALGLPDHSNYSKRAMAQDLAALMTHLGLRRFHVCGHDRGGRVTHRLCLDHTDRVIKACVIDIAPTLDMYKATDMAFAQAYYHWFFFIQPSPMPERLMAGDGTAYLHTLLGGMGGANALSIFEPQALAEYERCFSMPPLNGSDLPAMIHTMCEDYRASAGIDLDHDRESRARGDKIKCDLFVIWGERGVVNKMFNPLTLWQAQCHGKVTGQTLPTGHFVPEEKPNEVAALLRAFHV
jgi:haloacetate dehalogenase